VLWWNSTGRPKRETSCIIPPHVKYHHDVILSTTYSGTASVLYYFRNRDKLGECYAPRRVPRKILYALIEICKAFSIKYSTILYDVAYNNWYKGCVGRCNPFHLAIKHQSNAFSLSKVSPIIVTQLIIICNFRLIFFPLKLTAPNHYLMFRPMSPLPPTVHDHLFLSIFRSHQRVTILTLRSSVLCAFPILTLFSTSKTEPCFHNASHYYCLYSHHLKGSSPYCKWK